MNCRGFFAGLLFILCMMLFLPAVEAAQRPPQPRPQRTAGENELREYLRNGNYAGALALARNNLAEAERTSPPNDIRIANALVDLASVLREKAQLGAFHSDRRPLENTRVSP